VKPLLHEFSLSSASYRVRIALNLKGIAYDSRSYKLRAGEQRASEYLAKNPAGQVPTLEIDGHALTQSLAIIEYLDATRPEPRLIPAEPVDRAFAMSLAQIVASDVHPVNNLRVLLYLERELGVDEAGRGKWYAEWVSKGFEAIEALLSARPESDFAIGDAPSIVDACLVPQVFNARRYEVDLARYPRLVRAADLALTHPAFAKAAPAAPS
jgi:maleylacetoacetate isomerase/maleylpyruvate isomerase